MSPLHRRVVSLNQRRPDFFNDRLTVDEAQRVSAIGPVAFSVDYEEADGQKAA